MLHHDSSRNITALRSTGAYVDGPATDRDDKLRIYARENVSHVWLVDPLIKTLEVLRLDGATYRIASVHRDDARIRAEPFDAIELELSTLWAR